MTADDALREEIARALHRHATDDGEVHILWGGESEHEEEVAEWLPFADVILPIVARVEQEAYRRGQVDLGSLLADVSRVIVVTDEGRAYESACDAFGGIEIEIRIQDDGGTLKVLPARERAES